MFSPRLAPRKPTQAVNICRDYDPLQVIAPIPRHVNPTGITAWSSAPTFSFILLCNPMHYYLTHETGHLFGLPHATMYL